MQRDQGMGGADKIDAAPAVGQLVGHDLGNRQRGQRGFDRFLQAFGQRGALGQAVVEQDVGLAVVLAPQPGNCRGIGAQRGQLLEQGGRGVAAGIEADGDRHELLHHRLVGGNGQHVGDVGGKAARRGIGGDGGGCRREAGVLQGVGQRAGEGFAQLLQRLGRQFLDKEFDEQVLGGHVRQLSFQSGRGLRRPNPSAPSGSRGGRGNRDRPGRRRGRGCGCGRYRRRARSPIWRRGHRAG